MKMLRKIFLLSFVAIVLATAPEWGFAQSGNLSGAPLHLMVAVTKVGTAKPGASARTSIFVEGTIKQIYKNSLSPVNRPNLYGQIKFVISCYPHGYNGPTLHDDNSPGCDSLRAGSNLEVWGSSQANNAALSIWGVKPR